MTTKRFAFKSSKLSSAADQLWLASKSGFKADEKNIKLDLGRTLTKDKTEKSGNTEAAKSTAVDFIFGSKLSEKVIISNGDRTDEQNAGNSISELTVAKNEAKSDAPKSVTEVFEEIKQKGASSSFINNHKTKESVADLEAVSASSSSVINEDNSITSSEKEESLIPPKLDILTGEEGEINIYRAMCKLHSFDNSTKSWMERGLSCLRINERGEEPPYTYRIVGRVMGNQRVVLNSQIFPDMVVEKLSMRRVKFSATAPDSEVPTLFLATASEFVAAQLYGTLSRIVENKKKETVRKRKFSDTVPEDDNIESKKVLAQN